MCEVSLCEDVGPCVRELCVPVSGGVSLCEEACLVSGVGGNKGVRRETGIASF